MDFTIARFDAVQVIMIITIVTTAVQAFKKFLEKLAEWAESGGWAEKAFNWWAHSRGPVILSLLASALVALPAIVEDGKLTISEAMVVIGIFAGSNVLYKILRTFVFTKHR